MPWGPLRYASVAGPPSPWYLAKDVDGDGGTMLLMILAVVFTQRTALDASVTNTLPDASTATPWGAFSSADRGDPPSPDVPRTPVPATVLI